MDNVWLVWLREDGDDKPQIACSSTKIAKEWCQKHHEHRGGTESISWEWDDPFYIGYTEGITYSYALESFPFK